MKKILVFATVLMIGLGGTQLQAATGGNVGIGARLGAPTGLSVKIWKQPSRSMNFAAAWDLGQNGSMILQADYVFYDYDLLGISFDGGSVPLYYGVGLQARIADQGGLGIRIPVGLDFNFNDKPLDFFFELAPTLNLIPATDFELSGGIGAHYYF
ncbi:MAG: hypothetical protein K9N46_11145 [Candidatus Marinimicrobia bacterium]|nr:hypothetical protein [Candidatus Neomarinimicrobiota bacterium]MCF7827662.1 hypothetical protein [Candidatus Neomarinimicrobiota bacterium]MCF7881283.1 hypothetical protein [Candidatus Neomarinimicrobiota bacterium]